MPLPAARSHFMQWRRSIQSDTQVVSPPKPLYLQVKQLEEDAEQLKARDKERDGELAAARQELKTFKETVKRVEDEKEELRLQLKAQEDFRAEAERKCRKLEEKVASTTTKLEKTEQENQTLKAQTALDEVALADLSSKLTTATDCCEALHVTVKAACKLLPDLHHENMYRDMLRLSMACVKERRAKNGPAADSTPPVTEAGTPRATQTVKKEEATSSHGRTWPPSINTNSMPNTGLVSDEAPSSPDSSQFKSAKRLRIDPFYSSDDDEPLTPKLQASRKRIWYSGRHKNRLHEGKQQMTNHVRANAGICSKANDDGYTSEDEPLASRLRSAKKPDSSIAIEGAHTLTPRDMQGRFKSRRAIL
ncbi:hypothetical protein HJFPF1_08827 [Paramyrothecium foliicola]|nr:hypothetical protein HJFPF1_08827 [Paramyrothecium foliicola]